MLKLRSLAGSLSSNLCRLASTAHLDYSRYPSLQESDIEETLMRGSGPGGQAVNKTNNCVFLRHLPTGITVKCHLHRLASKNRIEARKILLDKLDAHLNGEQSIAAQQKVLDQKKSSERKRRQGKLQEMKKTWQSREREENEKWSSVRLLKICVYLSTATSWRNRQNRLYASSFSQAALQAIVIVVLGFWAHLVLDICPLLHGTF